MTNKPISLTELLAEEIEKSNQWEEVFNTSSIYENFAEILAITINENLPARVRLTETELNKLVKHLTNFVEEELASDALNIANGWDEEAKEDEEERKNIR